MNHFFDTNVMIGYIYSIDPLNKPSKKAIIKENTNYYSEHVKIEVKRVARRKDREYDNFLRKISKLISKTDDNSFIDLSEIHNAISRFEPIGKLDVNNMHTAIDTIWEELGFDENTDAFKVKTEFNNYWDNFLKKHRECRIYCLNKMRYIPSYHQKDQVVLDKIEENSLREKYLHPEDEKILFDVHDYLNNTPLDLLFISGDEKFVKAIGILIDVLSFEKYIYLKDYVENQ